MHAVCRRGGNRVSCVHHAGLRLNISGLVRTSGWLGGQDRWWGRCGFEDFHRAGLQSGHTRDSSLAVAAGGPQRWWPCCKPNLACGRWLVRSSLGSASGLKRGTGGWDTRWRAPLFSRPQSGMQFTWCPTSAMRHPSSTRLLESVLPPLPTTPILSVPRISRIRTRRPKRRGWERARRLSDSIRNSENVAHRW